MLPDGLPPPTAPMCSDVDPWTEAEPVSPQEDWLVRPSASEAPLAEGQVEVIPERRIPETPAGDAEAPTREQIDEALRRSHGGHLPLVLPDRKPLVPTVETPELSIVDGLEIPQANDRRDIQQQPPVAVHGERAATMPPWVMGLPSVEIDMALMTNVAAVVKENAVPIAATVVAGTLGVLYYLENPGALGGAGAMAANGLGLNPGVPGEQQFH